MYSSTEYKPMLEKDEKKSTSKWAIGLIGLLVVCGAVYKLGENMGSVATRNMVSVSSDCAPPPAPAPAPAPAPVPVNKCSVTLYRHVNYIDGLGTFTGDTPTPRFANDQVSSFRLKPGCKLTLYEHVLYRGRCLTFYTSDSNLVNNGFNDILSSFKLTCYVELFQHIYYRGLSYGKWTPGQSVARFSTAGVNRLNDQVSSARVGPGCKIVLYEHWDYRGAILTLTRDTPNFVSLGWNDKASSAKVSKLPGAFKAKAFSIHYEDEDPSAYSPQFILDHFEGLQINFDDLEEN